MAQKYKDKLNNLVETSDLSENQKLLWGIFLKISNPEEDEAVYEAANESWENLRLLTEHLRDKIWDMKENDQVAWKKMVSEEKKYAELI